MRVLILGGTLFIGRRIALELLARGDDVGYGNPAGGRPGIARCSLLPWFPRTLRRCCARWWLR
jgi:nucleoside-diphosphate-sugar epimerase